MFYAKCIRTLGVIEDREDHRMISLGMMHQPQALLFQNLGLTLILRWPTISSQLLVECITRTTRLLIFLRASKIYMNRSSLLMLRCSPRPTFKFFLRLEHMFLCIQVPVHQTRALRSQSSLIMPTTRLLIFLRDSIIDMNSNSPKFQVHMLCFPRPTFKFFLGLEQMFLCVEVPVHQARALRSQSSLIMHTTRRSKAPVSKCICCVSQDQPSSSSSGWSRCVFAYRFRNIME